MPSSWITGGRRGGAGALYRVVTTAMALLLALTAAPLTAQAVERTVPQKPLEKLGGSPNVQVVGQLPLLGPFGTGGIDIEQELSRPFVYLPTWLDQAGFMAVSVADPANPEIIYQWRIEDPDTLGSFVGAGETGAYFSRNGRYYYANAHRFSAENPKSGLCAVVHDVTGLPDPATVREVGRIETSDIEGGCLHLFTYHHSDGRLLLLGTPQRFADGVTPQSMIWDMDRFLAGAPVNGYVGGVPLPEMPQVPPGGHTAYHDSYVQFDPATGRDIFYGSGTGGDHVYDVTNPANATYIGSVMGRAGFQSGHTAVPSSDHRYLVSVMERQAEPVFIYDLEPLWKGETRVVSQPAGGWNPDWRTVSHNMKVRWPYVFVAAYEDGMHVLDMRALPYPSSLGWYYTCECEHRTGFGGWNQVRGNGLYNGPIELDVRNADGLIVVSDLNTGLWVLRLNGFQGWDGRDFGQPNLSSAQDWDDPPR